VLAPLLVVRVMKDAGPGPYGLDASLYVQNARHVAAGEGLITTISLYHHGDELPVRTTVQPLWFLVLGGAARAIGLIRAATLLPRLFYVVDLLLLFALARVIADRMAGTSIGLGTRLAPHAMVALLGTNIMFFSSTTHPYREGIAYCAAFAALLSMDWLTRRQTAPVAAIAGVLAGLAFLARLEFAAIAIACLAAMGVCRIAPRLAAIYAAATAITIAPWILYLGYVPGLARLGTWVDRPHVDIPRGFPPAPSFVAMLRDLVAGAVVEFQLGNPSSYTRSWGLAALLVPFAAIVALLTWIRNRQPAFPRDLTVLATATAGLIVFVELFVYRGGVFMHFMFGWRHGISLVLLLAVAVPLLLSHQSIAVRVSAAIAIAISVVTGGLAVRDFVREPNLTYTAAETALLRSLPPRTKILTTHAETLGMLSDAYVHNTYCDSPPESTRAYLDELRVDYVVVYDWERPCRFTRGLGSRLRVHRAFGEGRDRIWLLAPIPNQRTSELTNQRPPA
jgi:hypothetical protein